MKRRLNFRKTRKFFESVIPGFGNRPLSYVSVVKKGVALNVTGLQPQTSIPTRLSTQDGWIFGIDVVVEGLRMKGSGVTSILRSDSLSMLPHAHRQRPPRLTDVGKRAIFARDFVDTTALLVNILFGFVGIEKTSHFPSRPKSTLEVVFGKRALDTDIMTSDVR